jgi:molybdopterin synthase catalytic subunit
MKEPPDRTLEGASCSAPAKISCSIQGLPLDLASLRDSVPQLGSTGGFVTFEGIVRNTNHGRKVDRLEYEAYESLAVKEMTAIAELAAERFNLPWVRIVHRVGTLGIGETAVMIQVLAKHRREAFEGCHFIIDQIKVRVPIWKREVYVDGSYDWTRCHDHGPTHPITLEGD